MFGMADWLFAGDHGDCEQISVAVMPSVVRLSTREQSLFKIDELSALRRDILRYSRYCPPGPGRNLHRRSLSRSAAPSIARSGGMPTRWRARWGHARIVKVATDAMKSEISVGWGRCRMFRGESTVDGQFAERSDDLRGAVGLGQKVTAGGQAVGAIFEQSRGRDDFDRRPPAPDGGGQLQPIHGPRHLDIGENDADVEPVLEDHDRFVGVFCFDDVESAGRDHVDRVHADQELVFNDQDDRPLSFRFKHTMRLPSEC